MPKIYISCNRSNISFRIVGIAFMWKVGENIKAMFSPDNAAISLWMGIESEKRIQGIENIYFSLIFSAGFKQYVQTEVLGPSKIMRTRSLA